MLMEGIPGDSILYSDDANFVAIYSALLALSLFMIVLVVIIIKQTISQWKEDRDKEDQEYYYVLTHIRRPAVAVTVQLDTCVLRRRTYEVASIDLETYDTTTSSDIDLSRFALPNQVTNDKSEYDFYEINTDTCQDIIPKQELQNQEKVEVKKNLKTLTATEISYLRKPSTSYRIKIVRKYKTLDFPTPDTSETDIT